MPTTSLSLQTKTGLLSDIQIWSDAATSQPAMESDLVFVSAVNHHKIPLFLVSGGPFDVYTEHQETESYFFHQLVRQSEKTGILAKSLTENADLYIVFYVDRRKGPRVRCYYIDFCVLQQVNEFREKSLMIQNEDMFFVSKIRSATTKSDTSVFDRVLESKNSRKLPSMNAPPPPVAVSSALTTSQQISQAVNRVVLSGLRLRGLSTNSSSSSNDKIAIREIYQMTKKAALFALRKYTYDFNEANIAASSKRGGSGISLAEVQSIVKSLLQTFVDIEPSSFSETEGALQTGEQPSQDGKFGTISGKHTNI
ncbi:hypothetical protein OXX69_008086 [Metschnikowia pulcherrima]